MAKRPNQVNGDHREAELANFIREEMKTILKQWEEFVSSLPAARRLNEEEIRDHAEDILRRIASEIEEPQSPEQQEAKLAQCASQHGEERQKHQFTINETIAEFRELRSNVFKLWREAAGSLDADKFEELARFHESIDQALAESLQRYSSRKELHTKLFHTTLMAAPDPTFVLNTDGQFIFANRATEELCGYSHEDIVGKDPFALDLPFAGEMREHLEHVLETGKVHRGELSQAFPSMPGNRFEFVLAPVHDGAGADEEGRQLAAVVGVWHDITERKMAEEKEWYNANHDLLTGLPNRRLFLDRLEQEIKHAARSGESIAVLFIDLDGFKEVNDSFGHEAGDRLLCYVAQRLKSCVREEDTVARMGGDEFTIVLTGLQETKNVGEVAKKIMGAFTAPFQLREHIVHSSCSIGVARFPQDATTAEALLRSADQAMYNAKESGRNRINFFEAGKSGTFLH